MCLNPKLKNHHIKKIILFSFFVCNITFAQTQGINIDSLILKTPYKVSSKEDFYKVQDLKNIFWDDSLKIDKLKIEDFLKSVKSSEQWSSANGSIKEILSNDMLKLLMYDKLNNQEEVLRLGNHLLTYEDHLTSKEINKITGILYNTYRQLEAYNEITNLIPLLEKYQDQDEGWRAKGFTTRYDMAMINFNTKNYKLAANGYLAQKKVFDSIGNQLLVSSMYNNMGICYFHLKDYKQARNYYKLALEELDKPNKEGIPEEKDSYRDYFKTVIRGNIADIDFLHGNYKEALKQYEKERIGSLSSGEHITRTSVLLKLSKTYLALNNAAKAEEYADSAIASINSFIKTDTKIAIYRLKGKALLLSGKPIESMEYFSIAEKINDSIKELKISRDNLVAKVKFEINEKEQDLQKAKNTVHLKEKLASQQKIGLIITVFLFIILSYLYYKSRKDKNTINRQRENLQASVKEKETLLKEVHHRVKNNLQVISSLLTLQSKKVTDKNMLAVLDETQKHISSIAIIHEMLYQQEDTATISMNEYLKRLSYHILGSYNKHSIKTTINATNINLSINKAIPLGLMVNELTTNSLKHAFQTEEGKIAISIIERQNSYIFTYKDNGTGLPDDYEANLSKTMGFRLLKLLAEEMNTELRISNDNGLTITVQFSEI